MPSYPRHPKDLDNFVVWGTYHTWETPQWFRATEPLEAVKAWIEAYGGLHKARGSNISVSNGWKVWNFVVLMYNYPQEIAYMFATDNNARVYEGQPDLDKYEEIKLRHKRVWEDTWTPCQPDPPEFELVPFPADYMEEK